MVHRNNLSSDHTQRQSFGAELENSYQITSIPIISNLFTTEVKSVFACKSTVHKQVYLKFPDNDIKDKPKYITARVCLVCGDVKTCADLLRRT